LVLLVLGALGGLQVPSILLALGALLFPVARLAPGVQLIPVALEVRYSLLLVI